MTHHTRIHAGQVWQANRTDYLRAVRVMVVEGASVAVIDVQRRSWSVLPRAAFCTGVRGWSLIREGWGS